MRKILPLIFLPLALSACGGNSPLESEDPGLSSALDASPPGFYPAQSCPSTVKNTLPPSSYRIAFISPFSGVWYFCPLPLSR